jgi:hypothetical protein
MEVPKVRVPLAEIDNEGEPTGEIEYVEIPMTIATVVKMEGILGDHRQWAERIQAKPVTSCVQLLSKLLRIPEPEVQARLVPGTPAKILSDVITTYAKSVGTPEQIEAESAGKEGL